MGIIVKVLLFGLNDNGAKTAEGQLTQLVNEGWQIVSVGGAGGADTGIQKTGQMFVVVLQKQQ